MKCEQADLLMMKYIDENMTDKEAESLNEHLLECDKCKEAFAVYDLMMAEMAEIPQITAPEGFEMAVMEKIAALPQAQRQHVYSRKDKIKLTVAGIFAVLLSFGGVLIAYRDAIMSSLMKYPYISEYVVALRPVANNIGLQTQNTVAFLSKVVEGADKMLSSGAGLIAIGIITLCAIQFVIVKRRNR